jgi:hypothetical protein
MNEIFTAAVQIQTFCEQQKWSFCFIGGIAVQRWGQPRLTRDADLTLLTGFGSEETFINVLLAHFTARLSGALEFALQTRVVLLQSDNGVSLDIALGAMPFEERTIQRASLFAIRPLC